MKMTLVILTICLGLMGCDPSAMEVDHCIEKDDVQSVTYVESRGIGSGPVWSVITTENGDSYKIAGVQSTNDKTYPICFGHVKGYGYCGSIASDNSCYKTR